MNSDESNDLLRDVGVIIRQGLQSLMSLQSADHNGTVLNGYPVTIVQRNAQTEAPPPRERVINLSRYRWSSKTLIVDDNLNGLHVTSERLSGGGRQFVARVNGHSFARGQARAPGMRRAQGGVLVWEYRLQARAKQDAGQAPNVEVTFSPFVNLLSFATLPQSVFPTAGLTFVDVFEPPAIKSSNGVLYQLAAQYPQTGLLTLYAPTPSVGPPTGGAYYNNAFWNLIG